MLADATKRYRVPLMWSVLDKAGNSNAAERIALVERYLLRFDVSTVRMLPADRDRGFIGQEWPHSLVSRGIPSTVRVKESQIIETADGKCLTLRPSLRKFRGTRAFTGRFPARRGHAAFEPHSAAKRLATGEPLIVAGAKAGTGIPNIHRKRWAVECLFAHTKSHGFNLDGTRPTDSRKVCLPNRIGPDGPPRPGAKETWILCHFMVPHRLQ